MKHCMNLCGIPQTKEPPQKKKQNTFLALDHFVLARNTKSNNRCRGTTCVHDHSQCCYLADLENCRSLGKQDRNLQTIMTTVNNATVEGCLNVQKKTVADRNVLPRADIHPCHGLPCHQCPKSSRFAWLGMTVAFSHAQMHLVSTL